MLCIFRQERRKKIQMREFAAISAKRNPPFCPALCYSVELAFVHPYCRISDVVDAGVAKRQIAAVYLKAIASEGFLEVAKAERETLYVNRRLLTLLSGQAQTGMFRK